MYLYCFAPVRAAIIYFFTCLTNWIRGSYPFSPNSVVPLSTLIEANSCWRKWFDIVWVWITLWRKTVDCHVSFPDCQILMSGVWWVCQPEVSDDLRMRFNQLSLQKVEFYCFKTGTNKEHVFACSVLFQDLTTLDKIVLCDMALNNTLISVECCRDDLFCTHFTINSLHLQRFSELMSLV